MEVKVLRTSKGKEKSTSINFNVQLKNAEAGKRLNENESRLLN